MMVNVKKVPGGLSPVIAIDRRDDLSNQCGAASAAGVAEEGSGASATCWAALAATAVRVEVAYSRTKIWTENSRRVMKMRNPTNVPTMLVPCSAPRWAV